MIEETSIFALAREIIKTESQDYNILEISGTSIVNHPFKMVNGQVRASLPSIVDISGLKDVLSSDLLNDDHTKRWWKAVFFEEEGSCTFDPYYGNLPISDLQGYEDRHLDEFIEKIEKIFKDAINLSLFSRKIYLVGEKVCHPLRYVLQSLFQNSEVVVAPEYDETAMLEKEMILCPHEELKKCKIAVENASASDITEQEVRVWIPLNEMDLNSEFSKNCKWSDLIKDMEFCYSVGKIEFKILYLSVHYDVYGNIFVNSRDINGKKVTKKIN